MRSVGQAYTELILFGEHAAVYGYPAIGLGLPWTVTVSLSPAEEMRWITPELAPKHTSKLEDLLQQLPVVFPEISAEPPVEISVDAGAPIGIGFGSSGALCVALTRSLFSYLDMEQKYETEKDKLYAIWKYSHELEKIFHNTPSGVDTALSTYGKLSYFEGVEGELPKCHVLKDSKIHLVIGALPRESDTGNLVSNLRIQKEQNKNFEILIKQLGDIAAEAIQYFINPPSNLAFELGRLANEAQQYLVALGLSSPSLDYILKWGSSCGAVGGKLSGAGGGGAYFLIAESEPHAQEIALELQSFAIRNEIHHIVPPTSIYSLYY